MVLYLKSQRSSVMYEITVQPLYPLTNPTVEG